MVCDKVVRERWCVTKLHVKDGVCERWCVTKEAGGGEATRDTESKTRTPHYPSRLQRHALLTEHTMVVQNDVDEAFLDGLEFGTCTH